MAICCVCFQSVEPGGLQGGGSIFPVLSGLYTTNDGEEVAEERAPWELLWSQDFRSGCLESQRLGCWGSSETWDQV